MTTPIQHIQQQLWASILRRRRGYLWRGKSIKGLGWAVAVMAMWLEWCWIRLTSWGGSGGHPRRHRWLTRVWEWVFRRLGVVLIPVLPLTPVKGRIWLYPRAHPTLDAGAMLQIFPMGVLWPVPPSMLTRSIVEMGVLGQWGGAMAPFSYPDLGTTTQLPVIRSLLKRGYSVAVPINPCPQHPETNPVLGVEPGIQALLTEYDDIWLVNFLELHVLDRVHPSALLPLAVMVESLHDMMPREEWATPLGLTRLANRCGFQSAVALPNGGSNP